MLPRRTWHEVKRAPIGPSQLVAIEGLDGTSPRRAGTGTPASGAIDHGNVSTNLLGSAHAKVCGTVHAYVAASGSAGGHVQVGAPKLRLAAGARVSGSASLAVGASVCVEGSSNLAGELTSCVVSAH